MQIDMQRVEHTWEAREVVRELDGRPHLLLRVDVKGGTFPQRALEPVARIIGEREQVASWFATISDDGRTLSAYFPVDAAVRGILEIGYFPVIMERVPAPFDPAAVIRLDRGRLDRDVIPVTRAYLKERGITR